jgi:hypothetical protein
MNIYNLRRTCVLSETLPLNAKVLNELGSVSIFCIGFSTSVSMVGSKLRIAVALAFVLLLAFVFPALGVDYKPGFKS